MTVKAIYENGLFRPVEPVNLPEKAVVELNFSTTGPAAEQESPADRRAREEVLEILSHSYETGQTDTAARHNEHQP